MVRLATWRYIRNIADPLQSRSSSLSVRTPHIPARCCWASSITRPIIWCGDHRTPRYCVLRPERQLPRASQSLNTFLSAPIKTMSHSQLRLDCALSRQPVSQAQIFHGLSFPRRAPRIRVELREVGVSSDAQHYIFIPTPATLCSTSPAM